MIDIHIITRNCTLDIFNLNFSDTMLMKTNTHMGQAACLTALKSDISTVFKEP